MSRSPWVDLVSSTSKRQEVSADVCVIGAGAAGIYLATELEERGQKVVLLEAGPSTCVDSTTIGFDPLFEASEYPGATDGRFFGMGGSTSRWGGALVPHTRFDLRDETLSATVWPHIVRVVDEATDDVLRRLGHVRRRDFDSAAGRLMGDKGKALSGSGICVQASLHVPFRRRNLIGLLSRMPAGRSPVVFYNAVARDWSVAAGRGADGSHISSVVAISANLNEVVVRADKFVIAAGAIESARILLEIDATDDQALSRAGAAIGCYLSDHLSVPIADVTVNSRSLAYKLFAPQFDRGWMRGFRLLEDEVPANAPRAFAHFIFGQSSPGFRLARELLGALQGRRLPSVSARSALSGIGDLFRMACTRLVHSKLYVPPGTAVHLQLDIEQSAPREHRVRLLPEMDAYGRRIAGINWAVTEADMARMEETAQRFLYKLSEASGPLPELRPRNFGVDGTKPYDTYHPVGTCRMGEGAEAVVDRDLKVLGIRNLWVASTGVLPSAGTANPTFTLLCLTHRLAGHLQAAAKNEACAA